jgi:predicted  nucleic acid-binding Zn-ribbon protein
VDCTKHQEDLLAKAAADNELKTRENVELGRKVSCLEERVKQMEQHKENGLNLLREEVERLRKSIENKEIVIRRLKEESSHHHNETIAQKCALDELEKMKVDYFEVKSSLWKKEQCIKELKICLEVIKGSEQQLAERADKLQEEKVSLTGQLRGLQDELKLERDSLKGLKEDLRRSQDLHAASVKKVTSLKAEQDLLVRRVDYLQEELGRRGEGLNCLDVSTAFGEKNGRKVDLAKDRFRKESKTTSVGVCSASVAMPTLVRSVAMPVSMRSVTIEGHQHHSYTLGEIPSTSKLSDNNACNLGETPLASECNKAIVHTLGIIPSTDESKEDGSSNLGELPSTSESNEDVLNNLGELPSARDPNEDSSGSGNSVSACSSDVAMEMLITFPTKSDLDGEPPKKRKALLYPKHTVRALEEEFRTNPYPKHATKVDLALSLNLTAHQIDRWFQNRRQRGSPKFLFKEKTSIQT